MKHRLTVIISVSICIGTQCFARLNETREESDKRYGKPLTVGKGTTVEDWESRMYMTADGAILSAEFPKNDNSVCGYLTYVGLTEEQVATALKANAQGMTWKKVISSGRYDGWMRDDGSMATFVKPATLALATKAGQAARKKNE